MDLPGRKTPALTANVKSSMANKPFFRLSKISKTFATESCKALSSDSVHFRLITVVLVFLCTFFGLGVSCERHSASTSPSAFGAPARNPCSMGPDRSPHVVRDSSPERLTNPPSNPRSNSSRDTTPSPLMSKDARSRSAVASTLLEQPGFGPLEGTSTMPARAAPLNSSEPRAPSPFASSASNNLLASSVKPCTMARSDGPSDGPRAPATSTIPSFSPRFNSVLLTDPSASTSKAFSNRVASAVMPRTTPVSRCPRVPSAPGDS
mmetsp:Transcript_36088/g.103875  ORF Transcript_36088/g.103875 Transcript_36088/m.103875 type:complete len:264 (+) Transcript_36088:323-1114(+)